VETFPKEPEKTPEGNGTGYLFLNGHNGFLQRLISSLCLFLIALGAVNPFGTYLRL
jgi:hypothetical protein